MIRWIATSLSALLFVQSSVLAYAPETNFWKDRQKTTVASLPANFSTNLPKVFPSALSASVSQQIPKTLQSKYLPILKPLSSEYGTIRNVSLGSSSKVVVHIQDIHLNQE